MTVIQNQLRIQDSVDYLQDMILGGLDMKIVTRTYLYIVALTKSLVFLKIRKVPAFLKYTKITREIFKYTKESYTALTKS